MPKGTYKENSLGGKRGRPKGGKNAPKKTTAE